MSAPAERRLTAQRLNVSEIVSDDEKNRQIIFDGIGREETTLADETTRRRVSGTSEHFLL